MAMPTIRTWQAIRTLADMIKFAHSIFALPFALIATFLAGRNLSTGYPTPSQLLLIVLCMVAARSFAMTFNRIADSEIDRRNPRTRGRPLPAGTISIRSAWLFLAAAAVTFLAATYLFRAWFGNPWPVILAVPTLLILAAYSYAKRFTSLAHFVLGGAIAFAPTAAWVAIHPGSVGWPALILSILVLFWIAGFDIIYACQDVEVDRRDGLFSLPAHMGIANALIISRLCHAVTAALIGAFGLIASMGMIYWVGAVISAGLLLAEQWVVRPNDLSRVNTAFFTINGFIGLLLGVTAIGDILARS